MFGMKGIGQPARRVIFQHLAVVPASAVLDQRKVSADFPFRRHFIAEPITRGLLGIGQRLEYLLRGRGYVDHIDEFRLVTHHASPGFSLTRSAPAGVSARTFQSTARRSRGSAPG